MTTTINPATGLPINDTDKGNMIDVGGNVFGTDNSDCTSASNLETDSFIDISTDMFDSNMSEF